MSDWKKIFNDTIDCIDMLGEYVYDELSYTYADAIGLICNTDPRVSEYSFTYCRDLQHVVIRGVSHYITGHDAGPTGYKDWCKAAMKFDWKQDENKSWYDSDGICQCCFEKHIIGYKNCDYQIYDSDGICQSCFEKPSDWYKNCSYELK
tara:strand:- start:38 stop:484 length:447 start_codon:yes stop_codon:yes gene_type:complete